MIQILEARPADCPVLRDLWTQYWNSFGFTPCFQGFGDELAALPGLYARPRGCLLLAWCDDQPAGAVAYRPLDEDTCEIKRLFVHPAFRGRQIAYRLMTALLDDARANGYKLAVGDTMPQMADALSLYDRMGFTRINGYPGSTPGGICIAYRL